MSSPAPQLGQVKSSSSSSKGVPGSSFLSGQSFAGMIGPATRLTAPRSHQQRIFVFVVLEVFIADVFIDVFVEGFCIKILVIALADGIGLVIAGGVEVFVEAVVQE